MSALLDHLARDAFGRVLDNHPELTDHGFGICDPFTPGLTPTERQAERRAEIDRSRAKLREAYPAVVEVAEWLRANIAPTASVSGTYPPYSYTLKHIAENALGHYVSNGELIAAALLAGYPMRRVRREPEELNAEFGMAKRDVTAVRAAVEKATGRLSV